MHIIWGEKENNISLLEKSLPYIHPDTDLLVLPETFTTGFPVGEDIESIKIYSETEKEDTIQLLMSLSSKYNIAIAGSFICRSGGYLTNKAFFIQPTGICNFADKKHLFSMAGEDKIFRQGEFRLKVNYKEWNISLVVCYDIRFPVWCRNCNEEYDLLLVVANWPQVRIDAWEKLIVARAIENLSYVAAVNCEGIDKKGIVYNGSSMISDFKGNDISSFCEIRIPDSKNPDAFDDIKILYGTLYKDKLTRFRSKFPAHLDADKFQIL